MDPRRPHVHGCFSMCMCMRLQVHMCVFLGVPSVYACAVSHLWVSSVYMCVCTSIRVSSQGAVCMPECQTSFGVVCPVCLHEHICVHVCVQVCGVAVERLRVHSSGRQRVFFLLLVSASSFTCVGRLWVCVRVQVWDSCARLGARTVHHFTSVCVATGTLAYFFLVRGPVCVPRPETMYECCLCGCVLASAAVCVCKGWCVF